MVIETAPLNQEELAEYCRSKGLYVEQVEQWRIAAAGGVKSDRDNSFSERRARTQDRKQIKALQRELRRKERALAEAAALLVLQKKARAIWGEDEAE